MNIIANIQGKISYKQIDTLNPNQSKIIQTGASNLFFIGSVNSYPSKKFVPQDGKTYTITSTILSTNTGLGTTKWVNLLWFVVT